MEKDKRNKLIFRSIGGVLLVLIILVYLFYFSSNYKIKNNVYIYIDDDDTADSVFAKIDKQAHPRQTIGLHSLARLVGYKQNIRSGRYEIVPGESSVQTIRKLKNGLQSPVELTIPNVRTLDKMAKMLGDKLLIDSTTFARAFTDPAFCQKYGYDTATIACLFIPNTYEIYWNISLDKFMRRMVKENAHFWNAARLKKLGRTGMSKEEVITLASIIDEETSNNPEKPMVAGMYINRLKAGMPLQADPTIKFAWKRFDLKRIYEKYLNIRSPYNTYRNVGLPPGPIRIASVAGIDAVLNFVDHDYYYMCAKEDLSGTHNFSKTYNDHLKNAAKYAKALNERGIK